MGNDILAVACRQANYNLQSEMRGYSFGSYEYGDDQKDKLDFQEFIKLIHRTLYHFYNSDDIDFNKLIDKDGGYRFSPDRMAAFFVKLNENVINSSSYKESLDNDRDCVVFLGDYRSSASSKDGERLVSTGVSFIPGANSRLRIGVTEEIKDSNEFLNGNIDICSDGEIRFNTFNKTGFDFKNIFVDKMSETGDFECVPVIKTVNLDAFIMDPDSFYGIKDYMEDVFEVAGLKSSNMKK